MELFLTYCIQLVLNTIYILSFKSVCQFAGIPLSKNHQADVDKVTANIERLASEISGEVSISSSLSVSFTEWIFSQLLPIFRSYSL